MLRDRLNSLGVAIEWGVRLGTFQEIGDAVPVRLIIDGREVSIRAAWLVGADGGHSTVRKQLGLAFDGAADETWIVADAILKTDLPHESIHMVRHQEGNLLLFPFPEPGKWRVLDTNPPAEGQPIDESLITVAFGRRLSEGSGQAVKVQGLTWISRFTIQQRQVSTLRAGRVFLAGDAAHVHSPASGQGMNTGIQDAFNLAWKIDLVHRGMAEDRLLDTYDSERRPVSTALLKSALIATRLIQSRRGFLFDAFTIAARLQDRIPKLHRRIEGRVAKQLSALGVGYGGMATQAGERFPRLPERIWASEAGRSLLAWLRRPEIKLLVAGGIDLGSLFESADAFGVLPRAIARSDGNDAGDLLDELNVGPNGAAAWLIRPDGYLIARLEPPTGAALCQALQAFGIGIDL